MRTLTIGFLAFACLPLLSATGAKAVTLANRVFVSARSGNDANACDNILAPCQTFAGAVTKLNPGGEAIVLDSGGYGPVTITKSLTIEAPPGVLAFIHPPSGDAITINAGASDLVVLRGLVLNGGSGSGIQVNTVGTLHVENCVISGFSASGLSFESTGQLFVKDTISRQNGGEGFNILGGRASIDHCRLEDDNEGVFVDGADVTVRDSVAAGNLNHGFNVQSAGSENSVLNVYQCTSTNNGGNGLIAVKGGSGFVIARVANSSIIENLDHGLQSGNPGVLFETLGNNLVRGNILGDVVGPGAITVVAGQ